MATLSLIVLMASQAAFALKDNYRVYAYPGSSLISNTSDQSFLLTGKSQGSYRQVSYVSNGKTRYAWVHRFAVDSSAQQKGPASLGVTGNYNVRSQAGMSASVLGNTGNENYKLTGRSQGVWREVISSDGKKGWVNRMAVTANPSNIENAETRTPSEVPNPIRKPEQSQATAAPVAPAAPIVQAETIAPKPDSTPVPFTIINPGAGETEALPSKPAAAVTIQKPTETLLVPAPQKQPGQLPAETEVSQTPSLIANDEVSTTASEVVTSRPIKPMPLTKSSSECNFQDESMKKNCEIVLSKVASGELPKEATLFSLKTFKETYQSYCDGNEIKNKIRNNCSFFFTNLDGVYKGNGFRSPAYMIDLCAGTSKSTSKSVVTSTYTNRGTGSGASRGTANYTDRSYAKTTLAGVFRTGDLTGFDPYDRSKSKYRKMLGYSESDPNCDGTGNYRNNFLAKCKVIRLELSRIGGSSSDDSKPMHTSPFNSSSGCPSLGIEQNHIMRRLASRGTSLYIAYTKQSAQKNQFEAHKRSCTKDPSSNAGSLTYPIGGLSALDQSGLR